MQQTIRVIPVCALGAALALWGVQPIGGQVLNPDVQTPPMAGVWILSPELSSEMSAPAGGGTGGGMGRGGGGMGRGGGGMGRGGGGMGRGGGMGGGMGDLSEADQLEMSVLRRETSMAAERLTLAITEHAFIVTDEFGIVREYQTDGEEEELDFATATIGTRTHWEGVTLKQEMEAGPMKVTRTYQLSLGTQLLVVTVRTEGGRGRGGSTPVVKWIYVREG